MFLLFLTNKQRNKLVELNEVHIEHGLAKMKVVNGGSFTDALIGKKAIGEVAFLLIRNGKHGAMVELIHSPNSPKRQCWAVIAQMVALLCLKIQACFAAGFAGCCTRLKQRISKKFAEGNKEE